MQKKLKVAVGLIVVVLLVAAGVFWFAHKDNPGHKEFEVRVVNEFEGYDEVIQAEGDQDSFGEWLRDNEEDLGLTYDETEYGMFITGVKNMDVDDAEQEWWTVLINDTPSENGVDRIQINDGETYTLEMKRGY